MSMDRRRFLGGLCAGYVAAGWDHSRAFAQPALSTSIPAPAESGIDHIVIVTMENRSFDHLLGWLPNANGIPAAMLTESSIQSIRWLRITQVVVIPILITRTRVGEPVMRMAR